MNLRQIPSPLSLSGIALCTLLVCTLSLGAEEPATTTGTTTATPPVKEKYKSPMVEKGIDPEFARHMFVEPELAKSANKNDSLWINDALRVGAYLRPRFESRNNLNFDRSSKEVIDRALQTTSIFFIFDPSPYVSAKVTVQDARVMGGEAPASSGDIRASFFNNTPNQVTAGQSNAALNTTDIREAFIMLKKLPLDLKIQMGRQIWAYGDQRMIGGGNWTINGLSYDGARIMFDRQNYKIHLFAARPFWTQSGTNGVVSANDPTLNTASKGTDTTLFGTYNSVKILDAITADVYSINVVRKWKPNTYNALTNLPNASADDPLAMNRARQNEELYTAGFRLTNRTENNNLPKGSVWDWTVESAWQSGFTGRRIREKMFGYELPTPYQNVKTEREKYTGQFHIAQTGFTFFEKLRIGGQVQYASGDANRSDGSNSTFQTLVNPRFGGIPYFNSIAGISENVDTKNLISKGINVSYKTEEYGTFQLSYFANDKAQRQDAWYAISGAANSVSTVGTANSSPVDIAKGSTESYTNNVYTQSYSLGKHLYTEIDLTWMGKINDNVSIWMGVGYLHAGSAITNYRNALFVYDANSNSFGINSNYLLGKHKAGTDAGMAYLQVNGAF
ncbi:alginate export family protein [Leptospira sp. 'Mane']|uniref:alginate export family protein n=1 Tax=Leptospira sp. 'Mane' TaxID=3387407 RepID=UPI00398BA5C1